MQNKDIEEFTDRLLRIFSSPSGDEESEDSLIKEIADKDLCVREEETGDYINISLNGATYIRFSEKMLGTNKFITFFNRQEGAVMRKICDGIFLCRFKERLIVGLVELKKNINNHFQKAIEQIEGSYLKVFMLLSLLFRPGDIDLIVVIGGRLEREDPDGDYIEKVEEFREKAVNLETMLKDLSLHGSVDVRFPLFLGHCIHEDYRKRSIRVYHVNSGDTFDISNGVLLRACKTPPG
jgi:hypothetical protein